MFVEQPLASAGRLIILCGGKVVGGKGTKQIGSSCYVSNICRRLSSKDYLLMLIFAGGASKVFLPAGSSKVFPPAGASKVFPPAGASKVFPPAGSVQWGPGGFQAWLQG